MAGFQTMVDMPSATVKVDSNKSKQALEQLLVADDKKRAEERKESVVEENVEQNDIEDVSSNENDDIDDRVANAVFPVEESNITEEVESLDECEDEQVANDAEDVSVDEGVSQQEEINEQQSERDISSVEQVEDELVVESEQIEEEIGQEEVDQDVTSEEESEQLQSIRHNVNPTLRETLEVREKGVEPTPSYTSGKKRTDVPDIIVNELIKFVYNDVNLPTGTTYTDLICGVLIWTMGLNSDKKFLSYLNRKQLRAMKDIEGALGDKKTNDIIRRIDALDRKMSAHDSAIGRQLDTIEMMDALHMRQFLALDRKYDAKLREGDPVVLTRNSNYIEGLLQYEDMFDDAREALQVGRNRKKLVKKKLVKDS